MHEIKMGQWIPNSKLPLLIITYYLTDYNVYIDFIQSNNWKWILFFVEVEIR